MAPLREGIISDQSVADTETKTNRFSGYEGFLKMFQTSRRWSVANAVGIGMLFGSIFGVPTSYSYILSMGHPILLDNPNAISLASASKIDDRKLQVKNPNIPPADTKSIPEYIEYTIQPGDTVTELLSRHNLNPYGPDLVKFSLGNTATLMEFADPDQAGSLAMLAKRPTVNPRRESYDLFLALKASRRIGYQHLQGPKAGQPVVVKIPHH